MNKQSNKMVSNYYGGCGGVGRFIWSTELVKLQKTRVKQILISKSGTLKGIAKKLGIEYYEAEILLYGLDQMGKVKKFIGNDYIDGYCVIDKTMPEFSE